MNKDPHSGVELFCFSKAVIVNKASIIYLIIMDKIVLGAL